MRGTSDGRLMVGGADVPFKNAAARELLLPRQVRRLQEQYQDLFGAELPPVAYAWAGSFAETRDGLPFIGRVPGMNPRLQFALCYGGNGITYSVHAGDMIRAGIEGREHALDDVFGFGRLEADLSAGRQRGVAESEGCPRASCPCRGQTGRRMRQRGRSLPEANDADGPGIPEALQKQAEVINRKEGGLRVIVSLPLPGQ